LMNNKNNLKLCRLTQNDLRDVDAKK
jgi:hypothetical protein